MTDKKLSRRNLFVPRPAEREAPPAPRTVNAPARSDGFSLDAFYAARPVAQTPEAALPAFALRPGLPQVETVRTGTPELVERPATTHPRRHVASLPIAVVVRIESARCLAWQHSFCTVCTEHCPEPGAIVSEQGRPTVDASACTGCGICVQVCPAPINAFETLARS